MPAQSLGCSAAVPGSLGKVEIGENAASRAIHSVAPGRKNYLLAGLDVGGEGAVMVYSLIGTAKFNGLDPLRYLHAVIERINDHQGQRRRSIPAMEYPPGRQPGRLIQPYQTATAALFGARQ